MSNTPTHYIVMDPRPDRPQADYVMAFPDSRNGRWFNAPEVSTNASKALHIKSRRTASRVRNLIPSAIIIAVSGHWTTLTRRMYERIGA